jgi:hypothetical protein
MKCPQCNHIQQNSVICLTSNPPQYEWQCNYCDFELPYYERKDSFKQITQEELDFYYHKMKKVLNE